MPASSRTGRHSAATVSPVRAVLKTIVVFGGGLAIAIAAATGTYALWNTAAPVQGATINAGTIGLTINGQTNFAVDLTGTTLLPGRSVVQATPLQFVNTGHTPINVTASSIVFTPASAAVQPHLQISLRPAVAATCTVTPEATPLPASIAPISFTVGQTRPMCLEVRLVSTAPSTVQGLTAAFTINLAVTQVAS